MAEPSSTPSPVAPVIMQKSPSKSSKLDVDNFVPETDAIENFLDEEPATADRLAVLNINEEDTDDEDTPNHDNPMVASFAEDVEIDDYVPGQQETVNTILLFLNKLLFSTSTRLKRLILGSRRHGFII